MQLGKKQAASKRDCLILIRLKRIHVISNECERSFFTQAKEPLSKSQQSRQLILIQFPDALRDVVLQHKREELLLFIDGVAVKPPTLPLDIPDCIDLFSNLTRY